MTEHACERTLDGLTSFISNVLNIRYTNGGSPNQPEYADTDDEGTQ
jgi:hypothetical protein